MRYVVTGATGRLGQLVVEALLQRGVAPDQIVATGRRLAALDGFRDRGLTVRSAPYTDPEALAAAFADADRILLVSSSDIGQRIEQHRTAIAAAKEAGAGLVAYTSIPNADTSSLKLAVEHRAAERDLRESGLPFVMLRNGWYLENYTEAIGVYLERGVFGAAGDGRVSCAGRADLAEVAAKVLTEPGHAGKVYELGGQAFTLPELAAEISASSGRQITYTNLPESAYAEALASAGLPAPIAAVLADADRGLAEGDLLVTDDTLERLLGRRPTTMPEAVAAAVAEAMG